MPILRSYYQDVYRSPVVRLDGYSGRHGLTSSILAYLDFGGATGTSKDGLAETMLAFATERGALQPGMPVVEASSGSFGAALKIALSQCAKRGLFSNEAGMGSTPHAHAVAKVDKPEEQGIVAMIGVFLDTFVVLTLTALVILSTNSLGSGAEGVALAQLAFSKVFGNFGGVFIAICLLFFAFSTIIGWYFFGEQNIKYLFGQKAVKIYALLVVIFVIIGSTLKVDLVWNLSDLFNGIMVFPNLLALLALSGLVVAISRGKDK